MTTPQTRTIKAAEFTAQCRTLIDEVAATGEEIIVTKQGKPVGKFVPAEQPRRSLWGLLASDIEIIGDIVSPNDMGSDATRTIKASEFKAKCLRLMDEVAATGDGITVTKRGKPIGKFVPMETPQWPPWGKYSSQFKFAGDVMSPINVEWESDSKTDKVLHPR